MRDEDKFFMMCRSMGCPPISTIGFGRTIVSSLRRLPRPPARIITFMTPTAACSGPALSPVHLRLAPCARRSNRKYAKLRHGHHQLGLQTPRPKLRRDGLAIMPGEQHHVIRLLANEALVVDHWNMLARQIQTKLE